MSSPNHSQDDGEDNTKQDDDNEGQEALATEQLSLFATAAEQRSAEAEF